MNEKRGAAWRRSADIASATIDELEYEWDRDSGARERLPFRSPMRNPARSTLPIGLWAIGKVWRATRRGKFASFISLTRLRSPRRHPRQGPPRTNLDISRIPAVETVALSASYPLVVGDVNLRHEFGIYNYRGPSRQNGPPNPRNLNFSVAHSCRESTGAGCRGIE
jgi:hypothetical protein